MLRTSSMTQQKRINKDVSEFVLYLKAETDIYLGDANGQDKITWTKKNDNNEYSCPLDIADFGEEKTFQVYYNDSCGQLTDAGITVSIVFPTEIQITNVSLVEESKCIVNSLHSVTLTADKSPKSKIYHAILVPGKHMQTNAQNAALVMQLMNVPKDKIVEILQTWPGINHRLQYFHSWKKFVDSPKNFEVSKSVGNAKKEIEYKFYNDTFCHSSLLLYRLCQYTVSTRSDCPSCGIFHCLD